MIKRNTVNKYDKDEKSYVGGEVTDTYKETDSEDREEVFTLSNSESPGALEMDNNDEDDREEEQNVLQVQSSNRSSGRSSFRKPSEQRIRYCWRCHHAGHESWECEEEVEDEWWCPRYT